MREHTPRYRRAEEEIGIGTNGEALLGPDGEEVPVELAPIRLAVLQSRIEALEAERDNWRIQANVWHEEADRVTAELAAVKAERDGWHGIVNDIRDAFEVPPNEAVIDYMQTRNKALVAGLQLLRREFTHGGLYLAPNRRDELCAIVDSLLDVSKGEG